MMKEIMSFKHIACRADLIELINGPGIHSWYIN